MAVSIKLPSGITVSSTSTKIKDIFKDLSFWSTEFPTKCGNCKSVNVFPSHRDVESNSYYEAKCGDCGHTLSFGQYKTGEGLFAKKKDGWRPPYVGKQDDRESQSKGSVDPDDIAY
jgi:phage FluMu protein Com